MKNLFRKTKHTKHLNIVANGFGGQSMWLTRLAAHRIIPATHVICADTGSERDCTMMDGTKISAREFYYEHIEPYCKYWDLPSYFVRAVNRNGVELPPIHEYISAMKGEAKNGFGHQPVPLFGSKKGRLLQQCTDKWKIAAIKQQAKRLGATTLCSAQGIHYGEAARRVKGIWLREEGGWNIYQTVKGINKKTMEPVIIKWQTHYYPLVDLKLDREAIRKLLDEEGIPYLISSECDMCPHQDLPRWERRTEETIDWIEELENRYNGQFYFTDQRIPLRRAIAKWKYRRDELARQGNLFDDLPQLDFGCNNYICGI